MKVISADISNSIDSTTLAPAVATPSHRQSDTSSAANLQKICWIETKQYPYQPDHQVELLHLQAEADALLLHLQAVNQRRLINS